MSKFKNEKSKSFFSRFFNCFKRDPKNKEELIGIIQRAQKSNLLDAETLTMIESVILYSELRARDVMLPKHQISFISYDMSLDEIIQIITESGHSRFPVVGELQNEIIGILHAKDLLRFQIKRNESFNLYDIIRQATFIPESKKLNLLLTDFRRNRNHMAIVVDEYGTSSGFITIEDIIEQIIGDIEDEFDIDEEAYIKTHGAGHYIIKAHTPIDEVNEQLHTNFSEKLYDTIGGIILAKFGYLPRRGESTIVNHFEFKVINADARRIKLLECFDLRPNQKEEYLKNNTIKK